ncbi:MAG: hypothetical protein J7M38_12200 [Armatimonadetes bacterium]|nr:hypothetical protein [Armatimonadota bacterium]
MSVQVGIVGSAGGNISDEAYDKAVQLGHALTRFGCTVITGACPGLPDAAARAAREAGALCVGISPALSRNEHREVYKSPWDCYDVMIYTGSGLMGREVQLIRSSHAVVILGGRSGTLGEFAIAYDEAKLIGAVLGTGGVADYLPELLATIDKDTGADVVIDADPRALVEKMMEKHKERVERGVAFRGPIVHDG